MTTKTAIQWTDYTSNIIHPRQTEGTPRGWYCVKVSEGCRHCYSESLNLWRGNKKPFRYDPDAKLELNVTEMSSWARMTKPRMIFLNSMTDTFLEQVPDQWLEWIFDAMLAAPQHTFQVLTKRAARAATFVNAYLARRELQVLPPHIWMMTSTENQATANERIPFLLSTRASVRGLSCEPLLGPIDLQPWVSVPLYHTGGMLVQAWSGEALGFSPEERTQLHWVIVGGESGGKEARPMEESWAQSLVEQCVEAGVAVFVKQMGSAWAHAHQTQHPKGGDMEEWPESLRVRQMPQAKVPT